MGHSWSQYISLWHVWGTITLVTVLRVILLMPQQILLSARPLKRCFLSTSALCTCSNLLYSVNFSTVSLYHDELVSDPLWPMHNMVGLLLQCWHLDFFSQTQSPFSTTCWG